METQSELSNAYCYQEFLAAKLPNRLHSYWIGIERKSPVLSGLSESATFASVSEEPAPYRSSQQFVFSDGTRVQKNGWQWWSAQFPLESTPNGRSAAERNCVAMSFDRSSSQWRWEDKQCSDGHGYICQYFIMT